MATTTWELHYPGTDHEYWIFKAGTFQGEVFHSNGKYGGRVWAGEVCDDPMPFLLPQGMEYQDDSPFDSLEDAQEITLDALASCLFEAAQSVVGFLFDTGKEDTACNLIDSLSVG